MRRSLSLLALLFLTATVHAQDLSQYEKILFPVLSSTTLTGRFGATFTTVLTAYTPANVPFYPANTADGFGQVRGSSTYAGGVAFADPSGSTRGRLLYFQKPNELAFGYDLISTGAGVPPDVTQLPVVREHEFRTGTSFILSAPNTPKWDHSTGRPVFLNAYRHRNTLRIYDVDNTGRLEVEVFYRPNPLDAVFGGPRLRADRREGTDASYPYYGELAFEGPCITLPTGNVCREYMMTVEIRPTDPTIRYYVLLSTTDNATQYVTIREPQ